MDRIFNLSMIVLGIFCMLFITVNSDTTNYWTQTSGGWMTNSAQTGMTQNTTAATHSAGNSIQQQSIIIHFTIIGILFLSLKHITRFI